MDKTPILVLNAGSSTLKVAVYEFPQPRLVWEGLLDWSAQQLKFSVPVGDSVYHHRQSLADMGTVDRSIMVERFLANLWEGQHPVVDSPQQIQLIGHRVVHGGDRYAQAVLIDDLVIQAIQDFTPFAPIHNPSALEGIRHAQHLFKAAQVAVFDTAFHAHLPQTSAIYPIPYHYFEAGIRRYGFHGTSHRFVSHRSAQLLNKPLTSLKLISCHLGNGCSLAAIEGGISIDTTMGLTPLAGLMMGTRSGDIDPSILLHLGRTANMDWDSLDRLLNKESGLLGVSGISSDLRAILHAKAEQHPRAILAYDLFIHRLRSCMGAMLASLGGIDGIIFTGGIGENASQVRQDCLANFRFLGISIDTFSNEQGKGDRLISDGSGQIPVLVIHTQEERAIAEECWQMVHGAVS
jgi:acetate kinase